MPGLQSKRWSSSCSTGRARRPRHMLVFKVLFDHENRIRKLESKSTITAQQFKTALLAVL